MLPIHDWHADLPSMSGLAGETKTIQITPQVSYKVENFFATDNSAEPGKGTRIAKLLVGNKLQRPVAQGSTLTQFFGPGPGETDQYLSWDGCPPGTTITVEVFFVVACTFDMTFFGRAVG